MAGELGAPTPEKLPKSNITAAAGWAASKAKVEKSVVESKREGVSAWLRGERGKERVFIAVGLQEEVKREASVVQGGVAASWFLVMRRIAVRFGVGGLQCAGYAGLRRW
jgi:hypothetical protein